MANTKKNQETTEMVATEELKVEEVKPEAEAPVEEVKPAEEPKAKEPNTVKKLDEKLPVVENMMANAEAKEAKKQKLIYSAMAGMKIIRN